MFFRGESQPAFPRRYHFTALQTRDRSQTIDCGSQGPSALLLTTVSAGLSTLLGAL